jgi:hypothetical protein
VNTESTYRLENDTPNVKSMVAELSSACENATARVRRSLADTRSRYARWSHQQDDGRLPDQIGGRIPTPWSKASDTRIRLVDEIVNDRVAIMKAAERRANLTVRGTESSDGPRAAKVQSYIDYLRMTEMRDNVRKQAELGANWRETHGRAFMAVRWEQENARDYEEITLEALQQLAAQQPNGPIAQMLAVLNEPDRDVRNTILQALMGMYPDLDRGEAHRQLNSLRTTGSMSMPVRYLRINQPKWRALKVWQDIFYPLNTEDIQSAPWVAERVTLTVSQVEEKKISEGWSEEFVDAVRASVGKSILDDIAERPSNQDERHVFADTSEEMKDLCEVFYFHYTHSDEYGVPCKFRTVISAHVKEEHGPDEPLGYEHGKYPYVELRRERNEAMIEESRSVAELAEISQLEVKWARDSRVNQTELLLQPPTVRPEREIGLPLRIQPRGEIGEKRLQATRLFEVRATAPAAEPLEAAALRDAARYFARNRAEDPVRCALYEQNLADDWCAELCECWTMTLQLAQQFLDTAKFSRIVGKVTVPMSVSRDEIQGAYDLKLFFNTDNLDPDRMKAKTERLQKVYVPLDRYGILNLAPVVGGLFQQDFPEYADVAIQSVEQATAKEIEDEQKNWALILAGEEPQMHESGQNFQLRLNFWQNTLRKPGVQRRLQAMPDSAEILQKRLQHLEFMVQQSQNAVTGRFGVEASQP